MSAECGAPLTRDFLNSPFINYAKGRNIHLVLEFILSAYKNHAQPNIEEVWTRIDKAILKGEIIAGYDLRKLREVRNAILDVLINILSSVHYRMEETLEWCDVSLDWGPARRDKINFLKDFLENPIIWLESSLRRIPNNYKYRLEFFQLLVQHENTQNLILALAHFLSQSGFCSPKYATNCADNLVRLLFTPIKLHPTSLRERFLYKLHKLKKNDVCGTTWLGSHWEPDGGKIYKELLWRIYLLRNCKERLDELKGWLNTYYLLVQMLRKGDTVITTNYDLFFELALISWPERQKKYGVTWGTNVHEIRDQFHSKYIPGTAVNYAKWEVEAEGYTQDAYQRMIDAEEKGNNEKQSHQRMIYEKYLKAWKILKRPSNWVSVLKLHGSLDWGICRTCKELFAMRLVPFYRAKQTMLAHRKYDDAHKCYYLCCHNFRPELLIVPPTWMKDYDNKVLVNIWSEAGERLSYGNSILFLGYSLPKLDKKIRNLFHKALYNRGGKPWDEIVVVNRSTNKVLPNYREVFDNIIPINSEVSSYLRDIAKGRNE